MAIRTFEHKGLRNFFEKGSKAGIQPAHASRIERQLGKLNVAKSAEDMNVPGWRLHELTGEEAGTWSVWVNGNYRITFKFQDGDAYVVDY